MRVAELEKATPYDVRGRAGHHGDACSFVRVPGQVPARGSAANAALALIVRGADTSAAAPRPESPGLYAVASGFRETTKDDHENMARQFPGLRRAVRLLPVEGTSDGL